MDEIVEPDSGCSVAKKRKYTSNNLLLHLFVDYAVTEQPGDHSPEKTSECIEMLRNKNNDQITLFQSLVKKKLNRLLPILLACNDDVNYTDNCGQTILHIFILYHTDNHVFPQANLSKHREIVKILIEKGASVDILDMTKNTPIHYAAANRRSDLIQLMLKNNFTSIDTVNNYGYTVLHYLIESYNKQPNDLDIKVIEFLVNEGADIMEPKDKNDTSPLDLAFKYGLIKILKVFLDGHCESTKEEESLLLRICSDADTWSNHPGELQHLSSLVNLNRCVNCQNNNFTMNFTPLHFVAKYGRIEAVEMFLNAGANIDAKIIDGITALHFAVMNGHWELVKLLVHRGANLHLKDNIYNFGLMHMAVFKSDERIINFLIQQGFDVDDQGGDGITPLHLAALRSDELALKMLICHGANVNCRTRENQYTPLHLNTLHWSTVKSLPFFVKCFEQTSIINPLLQFDPSKGKLDSISFLVQAGANLNARDSEFQTLLHLMTKNLHCNRYFTINKVQDTIDLLLTLLNYGAHVDVKDAKNMSPIKSIIKFDQYELHGLNEMLEYGGNLKEIGTPPDYFDGESKLQKYLKLLEEINLPIIDDLQCLLSPDNWIMLSWDPNEDRETRNAEIEKLKSDYLKGTEISLNDFLHMDSKRRYGLAQSILSRDLKSEYPLYHIVIKNSCRRAINKKLILDSALLALNKIIRFSLPHTCTDLIFKYMSKSEMTTFIGIVESFSL